MQRLGATLFYVFLCLIAIVLSRLFHLPLWHISPWILQPSLPITVTSGLAVGALVVILSHILDRFPPFARLNALIARYLPPFTFFDIVFLSILSSIGEELLFRGALLHLLGIHLSSFVFGLLHYGGKRAFLLWGLMGWAMGYLLGGLFLATGSLLAPILAHFTINYFNLIHLIHTYKNRSDRPVPSQET